MRIPKPRRRKRNGKIFGNFFVKTDGGRRWINLETQDASLALDRARLVAKGLWPPPERAAAAAASAALRDIGNSAPQAESAEDLMRDGGAGAPPIEDVEDGDVVNVAPTPEPAGELPPSPAGSPHGDPVAAAAAVAGGAAAAMEDASAKAINDAAAELGIRPEDFEEAIPAACAEGLLQLQGTLVSYLAEWWKKKTYATAAIPDEHVSRRVLTVGIRIQLKRWEDKLQQLQPWHVILGGLVIGAIYQVKHLEEAGTRGPASGPKVVPFNTPEAG